MRVNIPYPKKVYDPNTTTKQKNRLMRKFWKHVALSAKRK